ncbi:MAG TPA: RraA family protein [Tepidisphaeraceae bacterium]|jgi:regulator of RNase E activity RraA|nr:RraA family protein [Tepidisphaeraceae bacterium]
MKVEQSKEITLAMIRENLYAAVVCDVLDSLGFRNQSPAAPLTAQTGCNMLVGRCKTTLWAEMHHVDPRPYELELKAVDDCEPDDVLIAAAGGSMRSGVWGELLSTAAMNRKCAGVIVDGAVRDVAKTTAMKFPVFARGRCIYDSLHRQRVIDVDVPVEIGGVMFSPGDLVIADADGIVVVPKKIEREAMAKAWEKAHAENAIRDDIRAGMKAVAAFEKYGML